MEISRAPTNRVANLASKSSVNQTIELIICCFLILDKSISGHIFKIDPNPIRPTHNLIITSQYGNKGQSDAIHDAIVTFHNTKYKLF